MNPRFDIVTQATSIADTVADWATAQTDIRGLALIGSHARGDAQPDSDKLRAFAGDPRRPEVRPGH